MKKIMLINWRWGNFPEDKKFLLIEGVDKEYLLFISMFSSNESDMKALNDFIKTLKTDHDPDKILILTHYNTSPGSDIRIDKSKIVNLTDNNKLKMKIYNITGKTGDVSNYIYSHETGMINTSSNKKDYREQLNTENIAKVWDFFWNKIDLENTKRKIISLWLPLAVDIQGLAKVKAEKKASYYSEIKKEIFPDGQQTDYSNSLKSFPDKDELPKWKDIEPKLGDDFKNFLPNHLIDKFDSITFANFKELELINLDQEIGNESNPNFLPNWLQHVVNTIDDMILT